MEGFLEVMGRGHMLTVSERHEMRELTEMLQNIFGFSPQMRLMMGEHARDVFPVVSKHEAWIIRRYVYLRKERIKQ